MNNSPKPAPPSYFHPYLIYTTLFLSFLFIFFIYLAFTLQIPPTKLVEIILSSIFQPHFNICHIGHIDHINILGLYSFFLIMTIAIFISIARIKNQKNIPPIIRTVVILSISLFAVIQQLSRHDYFRQEKLAFGGKTISEKYTLSLGSVYTFAAQCRSILQDKHQGKLISDQDMSQDPYSTLHRFLSYHLYPTVSVRFKNDSPEDILILFYKNNPSASIPEAYQPLVIETTGKYILAIKKNHE